MSKPTLPLNSPDLAEARRLAAVDLLAAAARLVTGASRIGEDGPFYEAICELANEAEHVAKRLRDYQR